MEDEDGLTVLEPKANDAERDALLLALKESRGKLERDFQGWADQVDRLRRAHAEQDRLVGQVVSRCSAGAALSDSDDSDPDSAGGSFGPPLTQKTSPLVGELRAELALGNPFGKILTPPQTPPDGPSYMSEDAQTVRSLSLPVPQQEVPTRKSGRSGLVAGASGWLNSGQAEQSSLVRLETNGSGAISSLGSFAGLVKAVVDINRGPQPQPLNVCCSTPRASLFFPQAPAKPQDSGSLPARTGFGRSQSCSSGLLSVGEGGAGDETERAPGDSGEFADGEFVEPSSSMFVNGMQDASPGLKVKAWEDNRSLTTGGTAGTAGSRSMAARVRSSCIEAGAAVARKQEVIVIQNWLKRLVESPVFTGLSLFAILGNIMFIGIHSQISIAQWRSNDNSQDHVLEAIELGFCIFFITELVLRIVADVRDFVKGPQWKWNSFDAVLVGICIADIIMKQLMEDGEGGTGAFGSFIRILRVIRMARILRIIRVIRFFRSLRLMISSILHSLTALFWVFMLLISLMYACTIFFLQQIRAHLEDNVNINDVTNEMDLELVETFSTIFSAMKLLFMSICGGRDWGEVYVLLERVHVLVGLVFGLYIFFVVFGVLNVVTGAFVDSMRLVSQRDQDYAIEEEMKKTETFKTNVGKLFQDADADDSGSLSWEEFEAHLQDERVRAYFKSLQLDISEARALFVLLDVEETDDVPIDKFIEGCMRMRGEAKSIDVNMLLYENEKMLCKVTSFTDYAEDQFDRITRMLDSLEDRVSAGAAKNSKRGAKTSEIQNGGSGSERPSDKDWLHGRRKSIGLTNVGSEDGSTPKGVEAAATPPVRSRRTSVSHSPRPGNGRRISVTQVTSRLDAALNMIACCEGEA